MKLYASGDELSGLEARLDGAQGPSRVEALVELAWQLRQRESGRSLALIEEAQAHLPYAALSADIARACRARIALATCEISALFCRFEAAEQRLVEARENLGNRADPLVEGDAWLAEAIVAKARGQRDRELAAYDRGVAYFQTACDPRRLACAQAWAGYERAFSAPAEVPATTSAADPAAEPEVDPAPDALWLAARGVTLSRREPAEAAEVLLHASEQAQRVGLVRHAVVCTMNAGTALQGLGDYDLAAACFDLATTVARKTGWPALIGSSKTRLGAFLMELGRLEESRLVLSEAVESLAVTPAGINKANAASALAQTLLALGRGGESVEPMAEAIRMYREARSTDNLALCLIGQARALAAAGLPHDALASIDEAEALIEANGYSTLAVGIQEALADVHRQHALPPPPGMTAPNATVHYAEATLREGLLITGWKPQAALFVSLADAWAAAGDLARAYDYARKALAVKEQEAASRLAHPLAVLRLRRESEPMPSSFAGLWRPSAPAELEADDGADLPLSAKLLTPKEREILQLLARNLSNKEIATALEVSDETVKWHLKNMYNKLKAGSRKHAVTRARTLGVIDFSA